MCSETELWARVRKHPAACANKSIKKANKCVRCARGGYIVFIFYKGCKSLSPAPAPVRCSRRSCPGVPRDGVPRDRCPVVILDTIKAGLLFPALQHTIPVFIHPGYDDLPAKSGGNGL